MQVRNQDHRSNDYDTNAVAYRPSHADATYDAKYGIRYTPVVQTQTDKSSHVLYHTSSTYYADTRTGAMTTTQMKAVAYRPFPRRCHLRRTTRHQVAVVQMHVLHPPCLVYANVHRSCDAALAI